MKVRSFRAISVKELRDYRRNRFVVGTMTVLPLLFVILPLIQVFDAYAHVDSTNLNRHVGLSMLYMLVIPAFLPSTLSRCNRLVSRLHLSHYGFRVSAAA